MNKEVKMNKKKLITLFIIAFSIFSIIMILNKDDKCTKIDYTKCKIKIGKATLVSTIAYSKQAQMRGLMGVTELPNGEGMIFIYDTPQVLSFWMKNTLIPLSIAFVKSDGEIVSIQDMEPEIGKPDWNLRSYSSAEPVKYAIEAPLGWFKDKNISTSTKINMPKGLR